MLGARCLQRICRAGRKCRCSVVRAWGKCGKKDGVGCRDAGQALYRTIDCLCDSGFADGSSIGLKKDSLPGHSKCNRDTCTKRRTNGRGAPLRKVMDRQDKSTSRFCRIRWDCHCTYACSRFGSGVCHFSMYKVALETAFLDHH